MSWLAQATFDRTGIFVAAAVLAFFAVLGVFLFVLSKRDEWRGVYEQEARYVLAEGEGADLVEVAEDPGQVSGPALGPDGLLRFVSIAGGHADMRITGFVFEDGSSVDADAMARDELGVRALSAVEVADSKGVFVVEARGVVRARPPLDRAVRRDLEQVLARVLAGPRT